MRLWAGPSCIARAISRRRSSWAPSTIRLTPVDACPAAAPPAPAASASAAVLELVRRPRRRRRSRRQARRAESRNRASVLRLPSRTSTWALHHRRAAGQGDELGVRPRSRRSDGVASGSSASFSGGLGPLQLVALGLGPGLGDEHVDLGQLAIERGHLAPRRAPRRSARAAGCVGVFAPGTVARSVDQSSGIRIQPWRIA